jgi:hypothetical protein
VLDFDKTKPETKNIEAKFYSDFNSGKFELINTYIQIKKKIKKLIIDTEVASIKTDSTSDEGGSMTIVYIIIAIVILIAAIGGAFLFKKFRNSDSAKDEHAFSPLNRNNI